MDEHQLYKTGDEDAPAAIKDRNGIVVLECCRICGKAESELDGSCDDPVLVQERLLRAAGIPT